FFNLNKCPTAHVIAKPFGKYLLSLISIYPFLFLAFFDKAALYFFAWLGFSANKIVSINYLSFRLFLMVINFSKIIIIYIDKTITLNIKFFTSIKRSILII